MTRKPAPKPNPPEVPPQVIDLFEALKNALAAPKRKRKRVHK